VRLGAGVLGLLTALAGWVAWRGAHPDPSLFADPATLLDPGAVPVARGALPAGLAPPGWRETGLARFQASNLYEKIDGRADYFLSRGFRELTFLSLEAAKAPGAAVDVEFYDLSSAENALSALNGEKPPEQPVDAAAGSTWYAARNALFLARGAYYVRAIGSDEGPAVSAALNHLRGVLESALEAAERPWAEALFVDRLGLATGGISYEKENAFSFGFARDVHIALLEDGETEVFVTAAKSDDDARSLAARFQKGFLEYGEAVTKDGVTWIKDRYLGSFARATSLGSLVVGVRGAPGVDEAGKDLARLTKAVEEGGGPR
jgi:hypothetical protein